MRVGEFCTYAVAGWPLTRKSVGSATTCTAAEKSICHLVETTVEVAVPAKNTSSTPPLDTTVPLASPPDSISNPPLETVVPLVQITFRDDFKKKLDRKEHEKVWTWTPEK